MARRARLEAWLNSIWYGDHPPPLALRLLSGLYGGVSALRRMLYRRGLLRRDHPGVPVLVVGNLTVGGSGKTPTIIALASALALRGFRPGIASRGYGGRYREAWRQVRADDDPAEVGDEPLLMARRAAVPVVVARQRTAAARALVAAGCDLVLCDDGLQHLALARDLELLVLHGERRLGNGRLLPAGPLREAFDPGRFPLLLVNGSARPGEHPLHTTLGPARRLSDGASRPLAQWQGRPLLALAGIANPQRFFAAVQAAGPQVEGHPFPDHHAFEAADLDFAAASELDLLCTEKDAVKLERLLSGTALASRTWTVPLQAGLPAELLDAIVDRLRRTGFSH